MSSQLIKLHSDVIQMQDLLQEYTKIFEASGDGIDSDEQQELDRMQNSIVAIQNKISELFGESSIDDSVINFENKWGSFVEELQEDIIKYDLDATLQ